MPMKSISNDEGVTENNYRILITGANGFTGQHACTYFVNNGYTVFAAVRNPTVNFRQSINVVQCDLSNPTAVNEAIQSIKPDFILHLAGQNSVPASWKKPIESIETNVLCTAYLLDAIRLFHPKCRIIVVGSMLQSKFSDPSSFLHPYSLSKTMQSLFAEVFSHLSKLDVIIAKPTNLIGPGHSTGICSVLANKLAKLERGEGSKIIEIHNLLAARDFLDVRDAVKAYEILLLKGTTRKVYEITTGNVISVQDVMTTYERLMDVPFEIKSEVIQHEPVDIIQPTELNSLGWKPCIPFHQSLYDILQFYRMSI